MVFRLIRNYLIAVSFLGTVLVAESILIRSNGNEPNTLSPISGLNSLASNIKRDLFEPLMSLDADGNIILGQARSYSMSKNKMTYTFSIKENAKWSDGSPVTAYDFEYTYRYIVNPRNHIKHAWFLTMLNIQNSVEIIKGDKSVNTLGVHALSNKILQIKLSQKTHFFLAGLSYIMMSPIPMKIVEKYGNKWTNSQYMISNGAYRLKKWMKGTKIVLEKNSFYYNKEKVKIDKVVYLPIDKESIALKKYKLDEVDYIEEIPKNKYSELQKEYKKELKTSDLLGTYYLSMNINKYPFSQVKVRRALSYAIDREVISRKVMGTGEKPLYTFIPKGIKNYTTPIPEYQAWTQEKREVEAKLYMLQEGFTKDDPIEFELLYNGNEQNRRVLLAVVGMWKKVFKKAIKVTLKELEWSDYQEQKSNYDVVRLGWVADIDDASNMLEIYTRTHPYNHAGYKNKYFEQLLHSAKNIDNIEIRENIYQKLDLMLSKDMPIIPLFQFSRARLIKPYVHGYAEKNMLDKVFSKYLYIKH